MNKTPLSQLVTIVVTPREKHSSLPACLESLFSTIPTDIRVVLCMPKLPQDIFQMTQKLIEVHIRKV